ncbi:heme oxygenase-like protein [Acaromyces ingoldii]|uniref:Heme oxygenase-like protein n=1 Tax=Acaromyces ingoldii TaxID=215250 RepID=A0A316YMX2_9BASI|nr:heme oxygenase-like protein [Acaromyces ingoldii]PWN89413.1 heme oxygenase-like protein [Acaromyces ingoldii]
MSSSLTQRLLSQSKEDYAAATTHPFLVSAGKLTLSPQALQSWLAQDRFYALLGYTKFLGRLIARMPSPEEDPDTLASKQQRRRLAILAGAMANIDREVAFFEDVARENGLDLAAKPRDGSIDAVSDKTKAYRDFMVATAAEGTFEEGLVLLWAMEKVYLDAWTHASTFLPSGSTAEDSLSPGVKRALVQLIPNWSAPGFVSFVRDIADLVDELASEDKNDRLLEQASKIWRQTLKHEVGFWETAGQL